MKKFNLVYDRPTCLFQNDHRGPIGGGELYSHQIAECLSTITDMRYLGKANYKDLEKNHGFNARFSHTNTSFPPDIFVACSHFDVPKPIGLSRNLFITFFPNPDHKKKLSGYDTVITCSDYSREWVRKYWKKRGVTVYPYVDSGAYLDEGVTEVNFNGGIINVGRFLKERDGHGKRQDALLYAFKSIKEAFRGTSLSLCGSVLSEDDKKYVKELKELSCKLGINLDVYFIENPSRKELIIEYKRADIYWHANGYQQTDPAKCEHFGIVVLEAMASGCAPIIYAGGGFEEFHCYSWRTQKELVEITSDILDSGVTPITKDKWRKKADRFSRFAMDRKLEGLLFNVLDM